MFSLRTPGKLLLLLSASLGGSLAQSSISVPLPNGDYNTTFKSMELVDHSRRDPYAETSTPRALMVSLFHPAECEATKLTNYSTLATAAFTDKLLSLPSGTLEGYKLQVCDNTPTQPHYGSSDETEFPVVLFSPGLGGARSWYNALAQWVASYGYNVVTIDHTYDASIVEFPDGSIVYGVINTTSVEESDFAVEVRQEDAKFVLDEMAKPSVVRELIPGAKNGLDVRHAAIFGHSLGGATAANAMLIDSRLKGGINLDGKIFGPAPFEDQAQPFMIFGTVSHNRTSDPTWEEFWSHHSGWKKGFLYEGSEHLTFSDGPLFLKLSGLDPEDLPPQYPMGDVDGLRNLELLSDYVSSFLDFVLKGEGEGVPTTEYPEISDDF
jgi:dienelactone hydrolase